MTHFDISYDYRCPFAKNLHLHVVTALRAGADLDVTFVPWSLNEPHRAEGAPHVWEDPARDQDLLALAVSTSVRDYQPDSFLDVHEALFRARHTDGNLLHTDDDIRRALAGVDVDLDKALDDVATRRPHEVIGAAHATFEGYEAFGVPTVVVGDDAVFVRYMEPPTDDAEFSVALVNRVIGLIGDANLNEFKHTRIPR